MNRLNMPMNYNLNTDHWSKMRMNIIRNTINIEQRGRVLSWEKHQQKAARRELEAAIRGTRNLPYHKVGSVHSFQDILELELNGYVPGTSYLRRQTDKNRIILNEQSKSFVEYRHPLVTGSQYTLMTLPTDPQSDQTRSRVPVLQCRGKI